jgi:hypothetical protein
MRFIRRDGLGKPFVEAKRAADALQTQVASIAPEVEVLSLVVFTDPRAQIRISDPSIPVLFADPKQSANLKDYLRDFPKENRNSLTPDQIEAFEEATLPG